MNMADDLIDLKDYTLDQLIEYIESLGQPAFRGRQLMAWLYRPGITEFEQMTDLAKIFRAKLEEIATISRFDQAIIETAQDGTVKFAFRLDDGKVIESVLIPEEDRNTLCLSTQVGCAMGCAFCLTGKMGFSRNLRTNEIINQVCAVRDWAEKNGKGSVSNIVFMGMGEPLANLSNLLDAISILNEQRGLDISTRRITVSTCGLVPQILELGQQNNKVNLAISLHAVDNETRDRLMPINKRYPIEELLEACKKYPQKKRQRIMFEFTLLKGVNDDDDTARRLAKLLHPIPCKINLLAVNQGGQEDIHGPSMDHILRFQKILRDKGYTVFIRQSRGGEIAAACGQLAQDSWDQERAVTL